MINRDMRLYNYYVYDELNDYGQLVLSKDVKGFVKLAIYSVSQNIVDNIRYKDVSYTGITRDEIDDSFVIQYGKEKLKVLYVNPQGKYKQVFFKNL